VQGFHGQPAPAPRQHGRDPFGRHSIARRRASVINGENAAVAFDKDLLEDAGFGGLLDSMRHRLAAQPLQKMPSQTLVHSAVSFAR
jgi:hypothetical protein